MVRREAVELQVRRMMQQLASNPDKLAQAIRRIDSGETLGGGDGEEPTADRGRTVHGVRQRRCAVVRAKKTRHEWASRTDDHTT